jgi:hypothetical protein
VGGEVKFWDLAASSAYKTLPTYTKSGMSAFAVHDFAPVFAWYLLCCCFFGVADACVVELRIRRSKCLILREQN